MLTRRKFLQSSAMAGTAFALPGFAIKGPAYAASLCDAFELECDGLSDPALQPKFQNYAPNALDPGFLFKDLNENGGPAHKPDFSIRAAETVQETGLIDPKSGRRLKTKVWGYGADTVSWPGQTFQVRSSKYWDGDRETIVRWENELGNKHLLPVDESLHWCYSLHGSNSANGEDYRKYSLKKNGVPIVTHLHGGFSDYQYDGNPEFFFSPDGGVKGPQWDFVPGGFTNTFRYDNAVEAGNLWYHDHALGITRLNVYAGLAGFYFVRDMWDTGMPGNPLGLPAFPYELAYAIQDRMFTDRGALFYPAFPGDPAYDDFITGEGAELPEELFPGGGPTALAEFFGDHIVVNGVIWPKADVEPRPYRLRLLNGCDSRFMVLRLRKVPLGTTELPSEEPSENEILKFAVIGADQGLSPEPLLHAEYLVFEPGGRYDLIVDFAGSAGLRIIMENLAGDAPFGGSFGPDLEAEDLFPDRQTDRIMAFDVVEPLKAEPDDVQLGTISLLGRKYDPVPNDQCPVRRVALFEGTDEFGRLQPLLGTVEEDLSAATPYTWFMETTEAPEQGATEIWEIYNFTADAHPIHLHLVNFKTLDRQTFTYEVEGEVSVLQHNGELGTAPKIRHIELLNEHPQREGYFEAAPRDMVISLPGNPEPEEEWGIPPTGELVRIKVSFEKAGRYVWHCHILSHEDHEMMRVLQVTPIA